MTSDQKNTDTQVVPKGSRQPRESFEKTLRRMLTKATSKEVFEIPWSLTCTGECGLAEVKVLGLWIAGSFAREATSCGDLDMIMNVEILEGCWPSSTMIKKNVLGVFPDVSVYSGTSDKNSSGVQFPEAVLL